MITSITLDNKLGGIASSLVSYSKALNLKGIKHHIILPNNAAIIDELACLPNVTVHSLPKLFLKLHLALQLTFKPNIKKLLKDSKLVLVHNAKILTSVSKHTSKCALINHSGKLRGLKHSPMNIFITRAGMARFQQAYPGLSSASCVINHGFEASHDGSMKLIERTQEDFTIIAAGRFVPKKGFIDLLKAAKILTDKGLKFKMKIFGDGELKQSLESFINENNLDQVTLMGWSDKLKDEFIKGDIFCIPSHQEPFGLIIGEAMLAGLPVVSTKTDGGLEIFGEEDTEGKGGILVEIESPDKIAEAIEKLMDEEKRITLANNAKNNIESNFSLENLATNLSKLINE